MLPVCNDTLEAQAGSSNFSAYDFHIPDGTASDTGAGTGTGVGTIRRFLISVGAIVITVGFVGVSLQVETVDRNDRERFGNAEADETAIASSLSAITETWKIWSLVDGAFGRRVRGTTGRLI